jgi:hypothetical protein
MGFFFLIFAINKLLFNQGALSLTPCDWWKVYNVLVLFRSAEYVEWKDALLSGGTLIGSTSACSTP